MHFELSLEAAQAHTDAVNAALRADDKTVAVERYFVCGRCGASRATFVLPGDAPPLSNLPGIVLQSAKERNIEILRGLTNPMTEADQLALKRMREMLLRHGRTVAEVNNLLSNGEHK